MGLFRSRRQLARQLRADTSQPLADEGFTNRLAQVAATSEASGGTPARQGARAAVIAVGASLLVVVAAVGVVFAAGVQSPPWAPEDESPSPTVATSTDGTASPSTDGTPSGPSSDSASPTSSPSRTPTSPTTSSGPSETDGSGGQGRTGQGPSEPGTPDVSVSVSASVSASPRRVDEDVPDLPDGPPRRDLP